jgi:hypothetical protein
MLRYNLNNITDRILFPRASFVVLGETATRRSSFLRSMFKRDNTWRGRLMARNGHGQPV